MNRIVGSLSGVSQARQLGFVQQQKQGVLETLATGLRINRAADDPAGLVSSEQLRAMLAELEAESSALERARGSAVVAERSLGEIGDLLVEAEALAVASANTGGLSEAEREANQMELNSILSAVDRLAGGTSFKDTPLLRGGMSLEVAGASVALPSAAVTDLGSTEIDGETYTLADVASGGALEIEGGRIDKALEVIRAARQEVVFAQGEIGAFERHAIEPRRAGLGIAIEGLTAAESSIRDTDYAKATAELARLDVLATATLRISSTGARLDPGQLIRLLA